jgi:hypothetical protein
MKILIASTPATGHLNPLLAIGHILIAEGHQVVGENRSGDAANLLTSAIASTLWCNCVCAASIQDLSP